MDLLLGLPAFVAWLAIAVGAFFVWGGYRHYHQIAEYPRFKGVTRTFWITVYGSVLQGVVFMSLGVLRLVAAS